MILVKSSDRTAGRHVGCPENLSRGVRVLGMGFSCGDSLNPLGVDCLFAGYGGFVPAKFSGHNLKDFVGS